MCVAYSKLYTGIYREIPIERQGERQRGRERERDWCMNMYICRCANIIYRGREGESVLLWLVCLGPLARVMCWCYCFLHCPPWHCDARSPSHQELPPSPGLAAADLPRASLPAARPPGFLNVLPVTSRAHRTSGLMRVIFWPGGNGGQFIELLLLLKSWSVITGEHTSGPGIRDTGLTYHHAIPSWYKITTYSHISSYDTPSWYVRMRWQHKRSFWRIRLIQLDEESPWYISMICRSPWHCNMTPHDDTSWVFIHMRCRRVMSRRHTV